MNQKLSVFSVFSVAKQSLCKSVSKRKPVSLSYEAAGDSLTCLLNIRSCTSMALKAQSM